MHPKITRLHRPLIYTKAFHKCRKNTLKREQSTFKCPHHSRQGQPQSKEIRTLCTQHSSTFRRGKKNPHTGVRQRIRGVETQPGAGKVLNTPGQHGVKSQQDIFCIKKNPPGDLNSSVVEKDGTTLRFRGWRRSSEEKLDFFPIPFYSQLSLLSSKKVQPWFFLVRRRSWSGLPAASVPEGFW